ncbi:MAG: hypothetical protein WD468_12050 [Pirellulales bacterium]
MIEETLRRFCESPHRLLIVIAGTFVVGLVLILPLVDVYRADHSDKRALLAELDSARSVAAELETTESRVAEKLAQLEVQEARTVDDDSLAALRGKLVDLAKETGCSIRRLSVGTATSRPWVAGDDAIATTTARPDATPSGFMLEWRPVSVSLSGSGASLRSLLERIVAADMLMHAKSVEMYPSNPSRQSLTLDLELWYFNLARKG